MPAETAGLAQSLEELNRQAELPKNIPKNPKILAKSAGKVFANAQEQQLVGDDEKAYILYMKFLNLHQETSKTVEYKKDKEFFKDMFGVKNLHKAIEEAERISEKLKARYELKAAQRVADRIESSMPDVPNDLDDLDLYKPVETKPEVVARPLAIPPTELHRLLGSPEAPLLMDVREPDSHKMSMLKVRADCIHIPSDILKPGTMCKTIRTQLSGRDLSLWDARSNYSNVVIMDWNSSLSTVQTSSPIQVLKDALWKWEQQVRLKCEPQLLEGGYESWVRYYPACTTNAAILTNKKVKNVPSKETLDFDFPSLISDSDTDDSDGGGQGQATRPNSFAPRNLPNKQENTSSSLTPPSAGILSQSTPATIGPAAFNQPLSIMITNNTQYQSALNALTTSAHSLVPPAAAPRVTPAVNRSIKPMKANAEGPESTSKQSVVANFQPLITSSTIAPTMTTTPTVTPAFKQEKGLHESSANNTTKTEALPQPKVDRSLKPANEGHDPLKPSHPAYQNLDQYFAALSVQNKRIIEERRARLAQLDSEKAQLSHLERMKHKESQNVADLMRQKRDLERQIEEQTSKLARALDLQKENTTPQFDRSSKPKTTVSSLDAWEQRLAELADSPDDPNAALSYDDDVIGNGSVHRREPDSDTFELQSIDSEDNEVHSEKELPNVQEIELDISSRKELSVLDAKEQAEQKERESRERKLAEEREQKNREMQLAEEQLRRDREKQLADENLRLEQKKQIAEEQLRGEKLLAEEKARKEQDMREAEEKLRLELILAEENTRREQEEKSRKEKLLAEESALREQQSRLAEEKLKREKLLAEEKVAKEKLLAEENARKAKDSRSAEEKARMERGSPVGQLPSGWQRRLDSSGRYVYYNHATGTTSSTPPLVKAPINTLSSASSLRSNATGPAESASQQTTFGPRNKITLSKDGKSNMKRFNSQPNLAQLDEEPLQIPAKPEPTVDRKVKPSQLKPEVIATTSQETTAAAQRESAAPRNQLISLTADKLRNLSPEYGSVGKGLTGLYNMGNTCYMNSSLQCLSNTVMLNFFFRNDHYAEHLNRHNPNGTQGRVASEMAVLLKVLWQGMYRYVVPRDFKFFFGQARPDFDHFKQMDSQEFLNKLLEALHEDLNSQGHGKVTISKEIDPRLPDVMAGEEALKEYKKNNDSIIDTLFLGMQRSIVRCQQCGFVSRKFDTFNTLPLEIPSYARCSLQDCLNQYLKEDKVEGYKCDKCGKQSAYKKFDLWKLPSVLLVFFKRFDHYNVEQFSKKTNMISFAENFVLPCHSDSSNPPAKYELYSVINHYGSLTSGHYTAFCKNAMNQQWYRYNDETVTPLASKDVMTSAAYVLFYTSTKITIKN